MPTTNLRGLKSRKMLVEQQHVFQNQSEIARIGVSARLPVKLAVQAELREKRRLEKAKKEQAWLK